jgi:hypothetical protein
MNTLARICWISSPTYLLVGMVFGVWMAASQDHSLAPAHAHLNLIGGVLMAIFGGFYTLFPAAAQSAVAKVQIALTHLAIWFMFPGIILALQGKTEALAITGSLLGIVAVALFLYATVRATASDRAAPTIAAPTLG